LLTRLLVCSAMAGARLAELAWSRQNLKAAGATVEGPRSAKSYPLIVALHTAVIAGTLIFGRGPRWRWLLVLAAAQGLRGWTLATLGSSWNVRGAVPEGLVVATTGPYRWIRHPNYLVIAVEFIALPLAFGMRTLAVAASLANAALLSVRIPEEEAALARAPGYLEHFGDKKRFVPRVW
jgi:methyltransferase